MTRTLSFDLKKTFSDFTVKATGDFRPGITALYGPSGAGKTTLLNLIAGIENPDEGALSFGDEHFYNSVMKIDLAPEKRKIGYVFQDDALFPHMSVLENLNFGSRSGKKGPGFSALVETFGLFNLFSRAPMTLSGGEKKRVAIARALLSKPDILLLDEPLSNIDARRREYFFPYLETLKRDFKIPIVYVSHQLDEVLRLADDMAVMNDGRIDEAGPLADVFGTHAFQVTLPRGQRGTLLEGKVAKVEDGLATIDIGTAELYSADKKLKRGQSARIRLLAKDVAVALKKPDDISILNVLPCTIEGIDKSLSGLVELDLDIGKKDGRATLIKAEITPRSTAQLKLIKGMKIYALIKALAIISPGG